MARTKISEFSATAADNTDIDSIDIAEGCAPSGINNAIRELMAQLKDFQAGTAGDAFNGDVNATTVDTTNLEVTNLKAKDGTAAGSIANSTGVVTLASSVLTTTDINGGTVDGAVIGGVTPAAGTFTTAAANSLTVGGSAISPQTGFRNRIINGGMTIDQRNAGASVTPTDLQYVVDRWQVAISQTSKFTTQQNANSVTPPSGFSNYLGAISSSAYSVVSSDYFLLRQPIEGLNISDLAWGTASAKTVTLSFLVYSNLTGTFGGSIQNSDYTRSYPFSYTVSVANTWTTVSVTIAGDTSGTWLTTNGIGINLSFSLGAGTSLSGTAGAWAGANYTSATGATSVVGTSGATFYITGVQLEKGTVATEFDFRSIGTELALCQRYYEVLDVLYWTSAWTSAPVQVNYKVSKRTTPTVVNVPVSGSGGIYAPFNSGAALYLATANSEAAGGLVTLSAEL